MGRIFSPLARKTNTQCTPSFSFVLRHSLPFLSPSLGEEEAANPSVLDRQGLTSQPHSVSRIPSPHRRLGREPHPCLELSPQDLLFITLGAFSLNAIQSQIPTFQEAALCPTEHSVAVLCEPALFCSFHEGMFPSGGL